MEANLPSGKVKLAGIVENEAWRQRHEAQKKARHDKMNDPAFRAKYEAYKKAKEEQAKRAEAKEEAKIQEKVRRKMMAEAYAQLGISEDYIEQQKEWIANQELKNPYGTDGLSASERLRRTQAIADGAGRAAGADDKERRSLAIDATRVLGGAVLGVVAPTVMTEVSAICAAVTAAFPVLGLAIAAGTAALLIRKFFKKGRIRQDNLADQAEKLEAYKAELMAFEQQVRAIESQLQKDLPLMVEKYKTMRKADFNRYLKSYVAGVLAQAGLTGEKVDEIVNEMSQQTANQSNEKEDEKEESPVEESVDNSSENEEEKETENTEEKEETSESQSDGTEKQEETPVAEQPQEQQAQAESVQPVETTAEVAPQQEEDATPKVVPVSLEEITSVKAQIEPVSEAQVVETQGPNSEQVKKVTVEKNDSDKEVLVGPDGKPIKVENVEMGG